MSDTFKLIIRIAATCTSTCMTLSPMPSTYAMHKAKSTGVTSAIPLIALWYCSFSWVLYGAVIVDIFPQIVTNGIGVICSTLYITVYFLNSTRKSFVLRVWVAAMLYIALVAAFAYLVGPKFTSHELIKQIVGWLAVCSSILLYGSPLTAIRSVLRTRDVRLIPIAMVSVGFCSNSFWATYGFLTSDVVVILPSLISVFLSGLQISLYIRFHKYHSKSQIVVDIEQAKQQAQAGKGEVRYIVVEPGTESSTSRGEDQVAAQPAN